MSLFEILYRIKIWRTKIFNGQTFRHFCLPFIELNIPYQTKFSADNIFRRTTFFGGQHVSADIIFGTKRRLFSIKVCSFIENEEVGIEKIEKMTEKNSKYRLKCSFIFDVFINEYIDKINQFKCMFTYHGVLVIASIKRLLLMCYAERGGGGHNNYDIVISDKGDDNV